MFFTMQHGFGVWGSCTDLEKGEAASGVGSGYFSLPAAVALSAIWGDAGM